VNRFAYGLGIAFYVLSGTLALGILADFVVRLFRWNLSPWWFWLVGLVSVGVLAGVARDLIRPGRKNRLFL